MDRKRFPHNPVLKELIGYMGPSRHCDSLFVGCYKNKSNPRAVDPYHGEGFRLPGILERQAMSRALRRDRTLVDRMTEEEL